MNGQVTVNGATRQARQAQVQTAPQAGRSRVADFVSATVGWEVNPSGLEHTTDGGAHWVLAAVPRPGRHFLAVAFSDADHGAILGGIDGHGSELLTTADGGREWSARPLPATQASVLALAGPADMLLGVGDGVLVSTDGGAHWSWAGYAQR